MAKAARRAWSSDSRFESYVALVMVVGALALVYREYRAIRDTFKNPAGDTRR